MDTISVLSSIIKKNSIDKKINSNKYLNTKLKKFNKKINLERFQINFKDLKGWKINKNSIYDINKKIFSIFFIDISESSLFSNFTLYS